MAAKLNELLQRTATPLISRISDSRTVPIQQSPQPDLNTTEVEIYLELLQAGSPDDLTQRLHADQARSLDQLHRKQSRNQDQVSHKPGDSLNERELTEQLEIVNYTYKAIIRALKQDRPSIEQMAAKVGVWPRISPHVIMTLISSKQRSQIPDAWFVLFQQFIRQVAIYQERKRGVHECLPPATFKQENCSTVSEGFGKSIPPINGREIGAANGQETIATGHPYWKEIDRSDWLLLEVEQNKKIRSEQATAAEDMMGAIDQPSLYQLQMGKGKSSFILPMIAAVMSSGSTLVRAVVLGPLVPVMFETIRDRLALSMQRPIYYLPISRVADMHKHDIDVLQCLLKECVQERGILVIEAEHIQSLELMEWDSRLFRDPEAAEALRKLRIWTDTVSMDILDESDEILRIDRELVYTEGVQRHIDFGASRWKIVFKLVCCALLKAEELATTFPDGFKIFKQRSNCLPHVRILHKAAEDALLREVFEKIYTQGVEDYKPRNVVTWNNYAHVTDFVLGRISLDSRISRNLLQVDSNWKNFLLLLRGLFGGGVLSFCLREHHWRVTFGLDPHRSRLAVPFRGKDMPSPRTDFGHPDVALILTTLSYLYAGLSDEQLKLILERVKKDVGGGSEYKTWMRGSSMPKPQQTLDAVNLLDPRLCGEIIFPHLRFNPETIQTWLYSFVFPSEMREFPRKTSASGWTLARAKQGGITGFSGTNDSRYLLPCPMEQRDLPGQVHTNAESLAMILQPRNDIFQAYRGCLTSKADISDFLRTLPHDIRVLIDVGAQLIDSSNEEAAMSWLAIQRNCKAAIFFDVDNVLMAIDRKGRKRALSQSPFKSDLEDCLVFLDEPHSRGTDLQLPEDSRALIVLGPDLRLDGLLQACMRMRKLAYGQSLSFLVPEEVINDVRYRLAVSQDEALKLTHLLVWAAKNSLARLQKLTPLWASQGIGFLRLEIARSLSGADAKFLEKLVVQEEGLTISRRYGQIRDSKLVANFRREVDSFSIPERVKELIESYLGVITARLEALEGHTSHDSSFAEQQQRELAPENEQGQEVQRGPVPLHHEPSTHSDMYHFVRHGNYPLNSRGPNGSPSEAVTHAINIFQWTSRVKEIEMDAWLPGNLLVSKEFIRVLRDANTEQDIFLPQIQFILGSKDSSNSWRTIITSHEANDLAPCLRSKSGSKATLTVYAPQLVQERNRLADLDFYSIPKNRKLHMDEVDLRKLSLFAGALFFKDPQEHEQMCRWLGVCYSQPKAGFVVGTDGFVEPEQRKEYDKSMAEDCPFKMNPIPFVRWLIRLRRGQQAYQNSDTGRLLNGDYRVGPTGDDKMDLD